MQNVLKRKKYFHENVCGIHSFGPVCFLKNYRKLYIKKNILFVGVRKKRFLSNTGGQKVAVMFTFLCAFLQGSRQKSSSLKGGGGFGRAIKEKIIFFGTFFSNVPKFLTAIKLEGDRGVRP